MAREFARERERERGGQSKTERERNERMHKRKLLCVHTG